MSDSAAPSGALPATDRGSRLAGPLTPEAIEMVLADFRGWLMELASGGRQPPDSGFEQKENQGANAPRSPVDLAAVIAQVTALRHEINLQTKSTRVAVEQTAEAMKRTANPAPDEALKPLLKSLIDIADALTVSVTQVEKAAAITKPLLAELTASPPPPPQPGFLARMFAPPSPAPGPDVQKAAEKLAPLLAGVADGYVLSLRRVERALTQAGLQTIASVGQVFDPETMEAVEAVDGGERPSGTVIEEVRRGYRWRGELFRFAQVKVAR